jgi:hypothetical protein
MDAGMIRARFSVLTLFGLSLVVAGCSTNADQLGSAFVDPARYTLYNCQQLSAEYATVLEKEAELRGLMDRAREGVAGTVVAETAYGGEYLTYHGRRQGIEEAARRDNCSLTAPPRRPGARQTKTVPR